MDDKEAIKLLTKNRLYMPIINSNEELKNYLNNRYNDIPSEMFTYKEIKYRLLNNIEIRPACRVCGKPVAFIGDIVGKSINGYRKTCSHKCHGLDKIAINKMIETKENRPDELKQQEKERREKTCLEKFGVKNVFIAKKEDIKQTMYDRYGGYTLSSQILRKKQEETVQTLYGNKNIWSTEYGKSKVKESQKLKYNGLLYNQTNEGRKRCSDNAKKSMQKRYNTNKQRYGQEYILNVPEFSEKRRKTIKNRQLYKSSIEENLLYDLLLCVFNNNDVERCYHDEKYPFDCDFYIKSLNLYIEYNGSQYHGSHLYTGTYIDNIYLYIYQKKYYLSNIDTWYNRDVKKVNIAKQQKLNFIVMFNNWHQNWKTYIKSKKYKHLYKDELVSALQYICYNNIGFSVIGESNIYEGIYKYLNWENSGIVRGSIISEKDYMKLSDAAKAKILTFEYEGETKYVEPKDSARGIVVKHLGCQVPLTEFFTDKVFTREFLEYLNENVIHPMFDLPDQSSFDDIKEIEDLIEVGAEQEQIPEE